LVWLLLVLALVTIRVEAAQDIRHIVPLIRDGMVLVSFEAPEEFSEEVRATIHSGLRTTFRYTVDLRVGAAAWVDQTLSSVVVTSIVHYDNLTRRHTIVRTIDGRVEEAQVVEGDEAVKQIVTKLDRVPLFRTSTLEVNREYYIRVRAEVRPRSGSFLWPFSGGRSGQAKFTFIR
jgi:hypothetical protein